TTGPTLAATAERQTRTIIGAPAMSASGFPGSRVASMRAGITTTQFNEGTLRSLSIYATLRRNDAPRPKGNVPRAGFRGIRARTHCVSTSHSLTFNRLSVTRLFTSPHAEPARKHEP